MTAAQLLHLAELADDAARYYRRTSPSWSRSMADTAHTARLAADEELRQQAGPRADLMAVQARLLTL